MGGDAAPVPGPVESLRDRTVTPVFIWENDYLGGTDEQYTNGMRLEVTIGSTVDRESFKLPSFGSFLGPARSGDQVYSTVFVGQEMFTPADLDESAVIPNDRPYAAWLYGGLRFASLTDWDGAGRFAPWSKESSSYQSLELSLGVTGSWAQGEEAQTWFHQDIHDRIPQGWDNQAANEVVVDLTYYRSLGLRLLGAPDTLWN